MYECSLCGAKLGEDPLVYWCSRCYRDWREAILNKEPWTLFLRDLERRRRYVEKDMIDLGIKYIRIGDKYDIVMTDGKTKLVNIKKNLESAE